MKQTVKRIIAREGLIILSLLLLASISFYIHTYIQEQRIIYESNVQELEITSHKNQDWKQDKELTDLEKALQAGGKIIGAKRSFIPDTSTDIVLTGINVQFPKNTQNSVISKTLKRDFPNIKNISYILWDTPDHTNINKYYDSNGNPVFDSFIYKINFSDVSFFFLLFAYPIYLILRFIVWAVKTLIQPKVLQQ